MKDVIRAGEEIIIKKEKWVFLFYFSCCIIICLFIYVCVLDLNNKSTAYSLLFKLHPNLEILKHRSIAFKGCVYRFVN